MRGVEIRGPRCSAARRAMAMAGAVALVASASAATPRGDDTLLAPTRNGTLLERAIASERPAFEPPEGVTGITVPHHLLAPDLIARGFWAASDADYDRVILIAPDHFHTVRGRFGTVLTDFDTVFGRVSADLGAARELLGQPALFEALSDVSREHGLHALTPFVRRFWPQAQVLAVLASVGTRPGDWAAAVRALVPLVGPRTLVVQSTDYSHYLPVQTAVLRDQESLAVIAAGEAGRVASLLQPAHLDSKAAQYVQLALQEVLGAHPVIVANRSSAEYAPPTDVTTSYVVTVFVRDPSAGARLRYADQALAYFGGDLLLGRNLSRSLADPDAVDAIVAASQSITDGAPLVVNLEGVLLDDVPSGVPHDAHLMLRELAAPVLVRLGVRAASLANNHSHDLGPTGLDESSRILGDHGITALRHGEVRDLGTMRVLPLGFVRNAAGSNPVVTGPEQLDWVCETQAAPPLVAFVHWGREYTATPGPESVAAARHLAACGVSAVVGAHSHVASTGVVPLAGGAMMAASVGNYVFDQSSARSSGALLEVRAFRQGTVAVRLIPLPNLFELGSRARAGIDG